MMSLGTDLISALPEVFLAVATVGLLLYGVLRGPRGVMEVMNLAILAVVVAGVLLVIGPARQPLAFSGLFVNDDFADFMKLLVLIGSALTMVLARYTMEVEQWDRFEFPVLLLFATLGMLMMVSAGGLLALYVGLELLSLSLYVVAAIRRDSLRSTEAGLKYFILGALSSGMLLYGASLVYGFTGTTSFVQLGALFATGTAPSTGLVVGLVFIAAGLAFKVSAVPFHMWTPDVYEGAPTSVTAFFAVAPKVAAMALFVRVFMGPFGELAAQWQQIIIFVSIASMVVGAFGAITQTNIKRLMAYSSIGHVGYALIGLAAATDAGVRGVAIYLAIYVFMNVGTFACILCMRVDGRAVENIEDLRGLSRTNPAMALAFAAFMFSMAGIPPLAGFFSKLYVFLAAIEVGLVTLAVIGVLTSVVAAYYYLRIVKLMYFDEPTEAFDRPAGRALSLVLGGTAIVVVLFFLVPSLVVDAAGVAASTFFPT